jgi:hypothetical protein
MDHPRTPAEIAEQINAEGLPTWGVKKIDADGTEHWVTTGLTFLMAKNEALNLGSNESDLDIDYLTQPLPCHLLTAPQTATPKPELSPRLSQVFQLMKELDDEATARAKECSELKTALKLEEDSHAATRAALLTEITALKAQIMKPGDPTLTAAPDDAITLAYLRKWYASLPKEVQDEQDTVIREMVKPWHKRGTTWSGLVRAAGKCGKTPYEVSPPKSVSLGQGAVQPKTPA